MKGSGKTNESSKKQKAGERMNPQNNKTTTRKDYRKKPRCAPASVGLRCRGMAHRGSSQGAGDAKGTHLEPVLGRPAAGGAWGHGRGVPLARGPGWAEGDPSTS